MALTKITSKVLADDAITTASLGDGIIQAAHLHSSHGITTSNIAEGSNEYHTTARARTAVSVGGSLAYNSSTGVVSFTQRTDGTIRGLVSVTDSGGDGSLAYNNSTGVITYTGPSASEVRAHISVTDSGGDGSLAYSNGVITYTGPSASEVRAHISAGTGIAISSGAISLNIPDNALDSQHYAAGSIDLEHMAANSIDSTQYVDGSIDLVHMSANSVDSNQYVDGSIDLAHMSADSIDSAQYVDGSIDLAHMSVNSIDSDQYVDGSIDTAHIAASQITNALMADDAIDSAEIADGAIDLAHMAVNSIDSDQYVDGSIDTAHIGDDQVTADKLANTAVTAASYGSSTAVPVVTIDAQGRITGASTAAISSSLTVGADSGTDDVVTVGTDTLDFVGTSNEIETTVSNNQIQIGLPNNVTIAGNLTVSGDTVTVNTATLAVEDPLVSLATGNNAADTVDIGIYGLYDTSGSQDLYGGLFRDASDSGKWKLFKDNQAAPTTTVNVSGTGYATGTLVANLEGNVTGNVTGNTTGTAATVTGATQAAITSAANLATVGTITTGVWSGTALVSAKIGNDQIDSQHYAAASIDNEHLADDAVDSDEIAAGAIDLAHMSANSIDSTQYVDGSIDTVHIAADQITSALIADDQIDSEHYIAGSIDNEHLADDAVDSDEIAAGAIDLAHMSVNSIDSDQYVDGSIDLIHMSANSIDSNQYVDGSIDLIHMSANSIDSDQYVDGSIDLAHMSANSIDSDQYVDGSIDAAHLAPAQTNITSLGTLTALTVDNLGINGNTITANSGALNLTPAGGSAIVLDSTINVDAGVVTGATSITSTAFVGALTGNASTATALASARTIGGTSFDGSANIAVALAATATALASARTIHGVSFDGTANIDLSEEIADTIGAMVGSNTESGITVAYQDGDNTLDFTVATLNQDTTGTAATVTTAAQPAITSLGTLTALTVSGNTQSASLTVGTNQPGGEGLYIVDPGHTGHGASNTVSLASIAENVSGNTMGLWFGSMTNENTGVIGTRTATGNIAFQTHSGGWGERMRITYDGKVGIGTASPSTLLDVNGTSGFNNTMLIRSAAKIQFEGGSYMEFDSANSHADLAFKKGSTGATLMTLDASGNLGIGTANPSGKLHVYGGKILVHDAAQSGGEIFGFDEQHGIHWRVGGTNKTIYYSYGDTLANSGGHNFYTGGMKASQDLKFQISNDGVYSKNKIGIGTATPSVDLHVKGTTGIKMERAGSGIYNMSIDNTVTGDAADLNFIAQTNDTGYHFRVRKSNANLVSALTMNSDGKVGLGNTSPNALLHIGDDPVEGDQTNPAFQIGSSTYYRIGMYTSAEGGHIENKNGDDGLNFLVKTKGQSMRIDGGTGNVGIGTVSPVTALTVATAANISQVALTSSSNAVAWDAEAAANAYHLTTENTTFSAPSNPNEGAIISVEIAQGGTARTVAWNTVFEFAASTAPTVTATASKTDIFSFRYNGSVWQEIGRVQNMAQT